VQASFSFETRPPAFDPGFGGLTRTWLDERSFVDYAPGWLQGSDAAFRDVLESRNWGQRTRRMYDRRVLEPRLTAPWNLRSGVPLEPEILDDVRLALSARYGVLFDSAGFNLYRDGRDSVAWHGDKIRKEIADPVVALLSLGEPRKFLLRRKGGGKSRAFQLGRGDLLVTGGQTQRAWEHCVPKVAHAEGPRISVAYRYGMNNAAYGESVSAPPAASDED